MVNIIREASESVDTAVSDVKVAIKAGLGIGEGPGHNPFEEKFLAEAGPVEAPILKDSPPLHNFDIWRVDTLPSLPKGSTVLEVSNEFLLDPDLSLEQGPGEFRTKIESALAQGNVVTWFWEGSGKHVRADASVTLKHPTDDLSVTVATGGSRWTVGEYYRTFSYIPGTPGRKNFYSQTSRVARELATTHNQSASVYEGELTIGVRDGSGNLVASAKYLRDGTADFTLYETRPYTDEELDLYARSASIWATGRATPELVQSAKEALLQDPTRNRGQTIARRMTSEEYTNFHRVVLESEIDNKAKEDALKKSKEQFGALGSFSGCGRAYPVQSGERGFWDSMNTEYQK